MKGKKVKEKKINDWKEKYIFLKGKEEKEFQYSLLLNLIKFFFFFIRKVY